MKLRKWLAVAFALTAVVAFAGVASAMSHAEGEKEHGEHKEMGEEAANPCGGDANPCGGEEAEANPCGGEEAEANPCGGEGAAANPCGSTPDVSAGASEGETEANPCGEEEAEANPCGAEDEAAANPCSGY